MEMSSIQCLRKFVNERLCAAAEEIFGVFEQTLVVYEEEIVRQRRLLDMAYKADTKTAEFPQPRVCTQDVLLDQYPQSNQERSFSLGQEDRPPLQIKEEEEELFTGQEEEPLVPKQEDNATNVTPPSEESGSSEDRTSAFDTNQTAAAEEKWPQPPAEAFHEWIQIDSDREAAAASEPRADDSRYVRSCKKKLHARVQTADKSYGCVYCKKEFTCSSSLTRHLRVHTGEKPYECFLCGKRFNVSTTLKVHYRIHTGEKPYKCKHCEKAFTTCSNLKKHMALHAGVK